MDTIVRRVRKWGAFRRDSPDLSRSNSLRLDNSAETQKLPQDSFAPHLNSNVQILRNDVTINADSSTDEPTEEKTSESEGENRKKSKLAKARHYGKILLLLGCWMFFTVIFILYEEREVVKRNSSLNPGEVKSKSMILSRRTNDDDSRDGFTKWPFMTTHTWGEYPQGTWTLEARYYGGGNSRPESGWSGFLRGWSLVVHGTRAPPYAQLQPEDPHSKLASQSSRRLMKTTSSINKKRRS